MVRPSGDVLPLALRRDAQTLATVRVTLDACRFFHLGETEIVFMLPDSAKGYQGRKYQSLGEAFHRIDGALRAENLLGEGDTFAYLHHFHAYWTDGGAAARRHLLGTKTRTLPSKRGEALTSRYSPELCTCVARLLAEEDGTGEWIEAAQLLPIAPRGMPDDAAVAELRRLEAEGRHNPKISSKHRLRVEDRRQAVTSNGGGGFGSSSQGAGLGGQQTTQDGGSGGEPEEGELPEDGEARPSKKRRKKKRTEVTLGGCIFVMGEDAPYRVEDVFDDDPPAEELARVPPGGQAPSRRWLRLAPLYDARDHRPSTVSLHVSATEDFYARFAEVYARHEGQPEAPTTYALLDAVQQHAKAKGKEPRELFESLTRRIGSIALPAAGLERAEARAVAAAAAKDLAGGAAGDGGQRRGFTTAAGQPVPPPTQDARVYADALMRQVGDEFHARGLGPDGLPVQPDQGRRTKSRIEGGGDGDAGCD